MNAFCIRSLQNKIKHQQEQEQKQQELCLKTHENTSLSDGSKFCEAIQHVNSELQPGWSSDVNIRGNNFDFKFNLSLKPNSAGKYTISLYKTYFNSIFLLLKVYFLKLLNCRIL